ncbi:MAG TPA: enoyl-CoA hydratase/isomerase family protein [Azospirillum sp.]|nr:enoyl-CoA hydratase/isomerase family protein [Azospirillum sp.]
MSCLSVLHRGAVAQITLDRPPVNALNGELIDALSAALDDIEREGRTTVVHIRSARKAFCAGADLGDVRTAFASAVGAEAQIVFVRRLQQVFQRIETLPLLTIAEINGPALGGGLEMALACDLRIVAHEARLGLPEVDLGLLPGAGGTQRLTRQCGTVVAKRLILGAEVIDGVTARELGLVQWAVPRAELADTAQHLVDRLAGLPPAAVTAAKSCIAACGDPRRDGFEEELTETRRLMDNPETQKRVAAFLTRSR